MISKFQLNIIVPRHSCQEWCSGVGSISVLGVS